MDGRLFGLDMQLLFDVCIIFVFLMLLYVIMTRLFWKPVREFLEKRNAAVEADREAAKADEADTLKLKAEYEALLKDAHKEAEAVLSASYKDAHRQQEEIIAQAKKEASTIIEQANKDAELEKRRVRDEVKQQMVEIADAMAGEFVIAKDPFRQALLLEETLKEMGGDAWQG